MCQQIWFLSPSARWGVEVYFSTIHVSADLVPFTVGESSHFYD